MTTHPASDATSVDQIEALVLEALLLKGWRAASGDAVASKMFTAVDVPNDAHAYFHSGDRYHHSVSFSYRSEGRNVAAASTGLIPVGSNEEAVRSIAASAIDQAERSIHDSYGVRIAKFLGIKSHASD